MVEAVLDWIRMVFEPLGQSIRWGNLSVLQLKDGINLKSFVWMLVVPEAKACNMILGISFIVVLAHGCSPRLCRQHIQRCHRSRSPRTGTHPHANHHRHVAQLLGWFAYSTCAFFRPLASIQKEKQKGPSAIYGATPSVLGWVESESWEAAISNSTPNVILQSVK